MRLLAYSVRGIFAKTDYKDYFKWLAVILSETHVLLVQNMRDMSVILQWKVIDERDIRKIFANNH